MTINCVIRWITFPVVIPVVVICIIAWFLVQAPLYVYERTLEAWSE